MKTVSKSKLTSTQCGTCRHWKSLRRVQNDPRGYCHKGTSPEARGRFSEGCNHTIILPQPLFVEDDYPHYIPIIPDKTVEPEEITEIPPAAPKNN
ncbi:MAG: hypothetical protein COB33_002635 [Thiotrichaceae bacterium]|nr:hypothetical protein [Thiotrichaceae bacterium]